jgi:catechol 2,3-dioxygenase-like lactoylglutathione lyase family enzyme
MTPPDISFSHVGIFVTDIGAMADFYSRVLGFVVTDRGPLGERELAFLSRDPDEHHQLVLVSGRPPDLPFNVVNQISLKLSSLDALKTAHGMLLAEGVREFRCVTHGNAWSVYFPDPEGNRVELFVDSPWHTPQPYAEPIDIGAPVEEIIRDTEARCRRRPGFSTREEWRRGLVRALGHAS